MNVQPRGTCRLKSNICVWTLACANPDFSAGGVLTIKQGLRVTEIFCNPQLYLTI